MPGCSSANPSEGDAVAASANRPGSTGERILREGVEDVGQDQLLVLLLVIEPDLQYAHHLGELSPRAVRSNRSTAASTCARKAVTHSLSGRLISPRCGRPYRGPAAT